MSDDLFLQKRKLVERGACDRYAKEGTTEELIASRKQEWQQLPILLDPALRAYSQAALAQSCGRMVNLDDPFPAMIWYGGATDTTAGHRFLGNLEQFVRYVLIDRASAVAEKRRGWVVTPTTSTDGARTNNSTTAVHALNLDCDGGGTWDVLHKRLTELQVAHILYQSGGWTENTPKWHALLPLEEPFRTDSPEKAAEWRQVYLSARIVFGALAELPGDGFDATVDTPSIPIFITERRSSSDPERRVEFHGGRRLDLYRLIDLLPEVGGDQVQGSYGVAGRSTDLDREPMTDDRLEHIIAGLCVPMGKILSGRRELYLALPGALLDRGLAPEDVLSVVEEISLRCPGDPRYSKSEVDSKHREHVHCARTTVRKWEEGETYTRIGTIADRWPEVATTIDKVLPDLQAEALLAALRPKAPTSNQTVTQAEGSRKIASRRGRKHWLAKAMRPVADHLLACADIRRKLPGWVLDCLIRGDSLGDSTVTSEAIDEWLHEAVITIGFHGSEEVEFHDILAFITDSMTSTDGGRIFTDEARIGKLEEAWKKGQRQRKKSIERKARRNENLKTQYRTEHAGLMIRKK